MDVENLRQRFQSHVARFDRAEISPGVSCGVVEGFDTTGMPPEAAARTRAAWAGASDPFGRILLNYAFETFALSSVHRRYFILDKRHLSFGPILAADSRSFQTVVAQKQGVIRFPLDHIDGLNQNASYK